MRLKFSNLIISLLLIIFSFSSCSSSFDYDKFDFEEIDGGYKMRESWSIFKMYDKYEGVLNIPETYNGKPILEIEYLGDEFGRGITKVVGSNNLEVINAWTFAGRDGYAMPNLKSVEFPENGNLKSIETMAFYWCENLHTVIVPKNFEYFGTGVFDKCVSLTNLVIYNPTPPSCGDMFNYVENDYWYTTPNSSFTVYVPDNSVEIYKKSSWGNYAIMPISLFEKGS